VPGCGLGTLEDADDDNNIDSNHQLEQQDRQKEEITRLTRQVTSDVTVTVELLLTVYLDQMMNAQS